MIRTQIYLTEEQTKLLRKQSFEDNITVSEAIRKALDKELIRKKDEALGKKRKNIGEVLLSMARKAEKLGFKGPRDLSSNVDKYLYGTK